MEGHIAATKKPSSSSQSQVPSNIASIQVSSTIMPHTRMRPNQIISDKSLTSDDVHPGIHNTNANARLRRKMIISSKAQKRKRDNTNENINPHNLFATPTQYSISGSATPGVQRIPLSPLPLATNTQFEGTSNSDFGVHSPQLVSNKNISHTGGYSPQLSPVFHDSVLSPNDQETTPRSEVINPSSLQSSAKSVVQPLSIIQSIPHIDFNDQQHHENQSQSGAGADFMSCQYQEAEAQEPIDIGDPSYVCGKCNAQLWYEERADKCTRQNPPQFSMCCMKGKVQIPFLKRPPPLLDALINGDEPRSLNYKENVRAYNSMFAFTSIGGKVESTFNEGGGPPQFILSGQNYHRIGSLIPQEGSRPKFAQLYIYDTLNETTNRCSYFRSNKESGGIDMSLVNDLTKMVDEHNELAKSFRMVRDYLNQDNTANLCLRLIRNRSKDARTHNLPTCSEVAALIVGDFDNLDGGRDIIVQKRGEQLSRLPETHASFLPLQYPLIFPFGEDGFHEEIPISDDCVNGKSRKRQRISMRDWIAFRIQDRSVEYGNIVNSGRLFQQFIVDCYTMVESQRLNFIRMNQKTIRCDLLTGLQEAIARGENDPTSVGRRFVLPSSFTGGMRYMFNNCQDAMAICKRFGYPDLFITITCNANWREIRDFVSARGLTASDRPDIVCRVFKMKLDNLMADFKKEEIFGKIVAGTYTIEFQKRGLPHAHILLWMSPENKLRTGADIDKFITAELPDPDLYPKLSRAVSNFMIHGPCGPANFKNPCMQNGKCSKYFPKRFNNSTTIDEDGYPCYKRRDTEIMNLGNASRLKSACRVHNNSLRNQLK